MIWMSVSRARNTHTGSFCSYKSPLRYKKLRKELLMQREKNIYFFSIPNLGQGIWNFWKYRHSLSVSIPPTKKRRLWNGDRGIVKVTRKVQDLSNITSGLSLDGSVKSWDTISLSAVDHEWCAFMHFCVALHDKSKANASIVTCKRSELDLCAHIIRNIKGLTYVSPTAEDARPNELKCLVLDKRNLRFLQWASVNLSNFFPLISWRKRND